MQGQQYPQPELVKDGRRFQWLPNAPTVSSSGGDEGGLNLGQVFSTLRRRIPVILGVTTVVTSAAVLKAMTSTPIYQGAFDILTKPVTVETEVISSVPQTLSSKEQQQPEKGVDATKLQLLKSPKILSPIAKELQAKYPDVNYGMLAAGLKVTPGTATEILNVSFQDKDPGKVAAILKLTAQAYIDYSLEERLADVKQGIEFVDTQLPQLRNRVEALQDELQTFRQQFNLIDPESTSKVLSDQKGAIGQQRLDTQIRLNEAQALYVDLSRQIAELPSESVSASATRENTRYQALLTQLLDIRSQIAKESSVFRDGTADIQVLKDQQQNLLALLGREGRQVQTEVASRIRELEARNRILTQAENDLNQQIKQLSVVSRRYADIQRELKIATDNLNQFLAKREALRIDAGQRKAPWQILTPPTDPIPSSANTKRSAMLGAILGVLLGVGVALLLDKISNILHSPEEVKDVSKLPILGVIPYNPELTELEKIDAAAGRFSSVADVLGFVQQVSQKIGLNNNAAKSHYTTSPFLEAFRSLYANIRLLSSDTQVRSIVISSCTAGEGKSTTSVYLAQTAAALGQRVLLVDTDLRLPQLHNRLGLMNSYGLSNLISLDLDFEQVVQQSPIEENLFVMTAGQIPPDPTKLLSSQKMQRLMEQFKEAYDLVIYDTPPLLGLADAKLFAAKTDGIVLVVGLGKVKSAALTQILEGLKQFNVSILGAVANGAKDYKANLYDSYYRYYNASEKESTALLEDDIVPPAIDLSKHN